MSPPASSSSCTNIPDRGIAGVPGSHHAQYIDVLYREHAVVETGGVRTAKAMGLRNLLSKTRPARQRVLAISTDWPWKEAFLAGWQRLCALPAPS